MSEKRILIASLLKPINDTRMYEKLGLSLCKLPHVKVHLVGYNAPAPPDAPNCITFHPLFNFKRLSAGRAMAQRSYYRLLKEVKPDIIIAATHELLPASYLYCNRHDCKLIYDIRENYALNLRSQNNYNGFLKQVLALGVSAIEQGLAPSLAHAFVAEQSYVQELSFLEENYTVLENKYTPSTAYQLPATPVRFSKQQMLKLLYSGTIAEQNGVFEAVALAEQLHQQHAGVSLTIIGYCAQPLTLQRLSQQIKNKPYITLIGGDTLVPHQQIVEQIQESHIGLLPYHPNPSTARCMPTKLFEYMAHALPVIVQSNPYWQLIVEEHKAGILIDYLSNDYSAVLQQLLQQPFYTHGVPATVFWQEEEEKLLQVMQQFL